MFRTPRKGAIPGGRSAPGSSSSREPRRTGLFENGQWFCDCEPRLPAVHLQTRKKGRNNGRWFYTCQKRDRKQQCGFFVFEDVAQEREKQYLFSGGREREAAAIQTYIGSEEPPLPALYASRQLGPADGRGFSLPSVSTGDEMDFMSAADEESQKRWGGEREIKEEDGEGGGVEEGRPSAKRKRGLFVDDSEEDEFGGSVGGDLNSDEEREMVALAESATQSQSQRRESQQTGQFTTPSAQRTHDVLNGLPTPNTGATVSRNSLLIATEQREFGAKRQKMDLPATPLQMRAGSSNSSSSARQQSQASVSGVGADDYPITEEIMALLGGVPTLDDDVAGSVRRKLNNYALRMKGVERGRDMVRSVMQERDARIAELQARVAQLEKERGADRERIKTLASLIGGMS
ncbi:hypothetical protein CONLIGDRAFT_46261 [Coniochaeta ligniaria NRRL 30616]|uniref:GRF-type domain-containing protein n=1 Tax=Coniochaeta ligniaria NRRL 30616 TaxID=1408157 RepID=A0A1J7J501_9PEZI|nr:hypothetical protein CONLIGDRAFT_46261 [Coniochaeta ligniaria NRRL 30616]